MLKRFDGRRGRVERRIHRSTVLKGNPWGDPIEREVPVYLPAAYDDEPSRRFPVLFALAGYTGSGLGMLGWKNFSENLPERLDRLIDTGALSPVIVVFPDGFTALGGNQYIDSPAVGSYATYLTRELVPFVDSNYRTLADRAHRGVFGKSSGGYGALVHGLLHTDTWGAVACHSGDLYFDVAYRPDFPLALDELAKHDRSIARFLESFLVFVNPATTEIHTLMVIAMAATYDPDLDDPARIRLPVDHYTGELDLVRWQSWCRWDPIEMLAEYGDRLRRLSLLFVDCGNRDQYRLHYGARILHGRLDAVGIPHVYQEFDDDHSSLDYRYDVSLPLLVDALTG
ncbi:MAG: enterochelin esterase [Planctomycetes bacterium]|nr:enterochelin esterase [Planctomycetota bacterium]